MIKQLTKEQRRSYSTALLNASISRKSVAACPLAFGETGVKERIKGVMSYKKPAFWVVIAAIAVCVVAAVCFLTNPKDANPKEFYDNGQRIRITAEVNGAVSEEKFIILNEGQNAQLSNGTKFTVDTVNLQTGETALKLKGAPIKNELGKSPEKITFYDMDTLSYFTQDGKTKITISCVRVKMLEECISQEIMKFNHGNYLSGEYACEANANLLTEISKKDNSGNIKEVTAYLMSMYQEYSLENGYIVEKGGNITPIALTFSVGADGEYSLVEYWEPGMGREYAVNLKAKFPPGVDYDTQKYVGNLNKICQKKAESYFGAELETNNVTQEYSTTALSYTPLESEYSLRAVKSKSEGIRLLTNEAFYKKNGYHVYLYCLDECYVMLRGQEYKTGDALNSGKVTAEAIVQRLSNEAAAGKVESRTYKDGGSTEYRADGYTVIKKNTVGGNRDVIIGVEGMTLNQINEFEDSSKPTDINGVTADISPEAEPNISGKIKEINSSSILIEAGYNSDGIKEGTLVTVRLGTVLSYAPDVDSLGLEVGDRILVIYDGRIMETYPLQIDAYAVYKAATTNN